MRDKPKKYTLNKPSIPSHQSEEFQKGVINAANSFAIRSKSKLISDKTKIQSPLIRYSYDEITRWLQSPIQNQKQLRDLSEFLYNTQPAYKGVVRYMATLPTFSWELDIDFDDEEDLKLARKEYKKVLKYVHKLNLKYEMAKASVIAYRRDFFFGYEMESDYSYFIFPLNNEYCKPSEIEYGIYNFAFDFSFFNTNPQELNLYPPEFRKKYAEYQSTGDKWIQLDPKNSVCFKVNIDVEYPIPPFAGMFTSVFDYEDYKKIKKDRAKNENYMLLHQKIPMDDKSGNINAFLIDGEAMNVFHQAAVSSVPDGVDVITSPMDITSVKTEKSKSDNDYVEQALTQIYDSAGVSQILFNSGNNTSTGVNKSTIIDEQSAFYFLQQLQAWVNRKLTYKFPNLEIEFTFLETSRLNYKDVADSMLKMAQYGAPLKATMLSALGFSPYQTMKKAKLENDILKLHEKYIPLSSSHTQSGSEGGAPIMDENEISESTAINRINETDIKQIDNQ